MYITFSVDKYEMLKGSKSLQVSAELSYGSPTISNKVGTCYIYPSGSPNLPRYIRTSVMDALPL